MFEVFSASSGEAMDGLLRAQYSRSVSIINQLRRVIMSIVLAYFVLLFFMKKA